MYGHEQVDARKHLYIDCKCVLAQIAVLEFLNRHISIQKDGETNRNILSQIPTEKSGCSRRAVIFFGFC